MSTVTVDSKGNVNVDWEYEVPCPKCGEPITHLRYKWSNIEYGDFYMDGDSPEYDADDNECIGKPTFSCPECYSPLFTNEKDAKSFLLSRSWQPDVLPMPLELRVVVDGVTYEVPRYAYGYCPECKTGWDKWKYAENDFKCPGPDCGSEMEEFKEDELRALLREEVEEGCLDEDILICNEKRRPFRV